MVAKGHGARRRLQKRQRERIYLEHFLAVRQLHCQQLIDGQDDGHEPDFSALIDGKWVGIELTTLPRLRDRVGNHWLVPRRMYWRLMRALGWPFAGRRALDLALLPISSEIEQADIDAVMQKKADKISHYYERRPLDQLWLLIHTDLVQSDGYLKPASQPLYHQSDFDQVRMSVYPARWVDPIHRMRQDAWMQRVQQGAWHEEENQPKL
jgi:hypothetical protein